MRGVLRALTTQCTPWRRSSDMIHSESSRFLDSTA
eukprot:CAMPEP_0182898756 /NCGR_PEP_ID=MMETSP0034_2-20130328/27676_1 /TAXON_ID=156128 /ORGANISM="Nephroselmis pyriformis, Strain CCMP717" /LENGTH=34 /DNA_ID= /DNA_START= /DNA_END= /DNA_ORIENTATION=